MNKIKVLLIEDDRSISNFITATMDREGYKIMHALNGREGLSLSTSFCPNVILLDLGLPDIDGLEVLQKLRSWSDVPVIIISARTKEQEKVSALDLGADDYITKPFRIRELLARMKAILRRTSGAEKEAPQLVTVGKNQVNLRIGKVYCGNEEVLLTAMEYRLLLIFLNHRGQVLSRGQILDQIWDGAGEFVNDNTLTVYVGRLRKKLGDTEKEPLIETVRGAGYRLRQ